MCPGCVLSIRKDAPSTQKTLPDGEDGMLFQEDSDPKHRSRLAQKWKEEHPISTLSHGQQPRPGPQ